MEMKEILGKKPKAKADDEMKKESKLKAIKEMRSAASEMMGGDIKDGLDSMKKVTVAAPDKEGLEKGLEKAKEMLPKMEDMYSEEEETEEGESEQKPFEEEAKEVLAMIDTPDEIEKMIKMLEEKKQSLK